MSLNSAHIGYAYQDLLTSYFILKEILGGNKNSLFSIDKKHTSNDRFDDLVIKNGSKIQRKQIKYSDKTNSKELAKDDLSNDSNYKLAIYKLYETWKSLNSSNSEFRLCLAWDEPTEENIKTVLNPISNSLSSFSTFSTKLYKINLDNLWEENPEKFNRWNSLKKYVEENNVNRDDFKQFCNELIVELEFPKANIDFNIPSDLEKILIQQAQKLGIGQYPNNDITITSFLERLAYKVSGYRAKSIEITSQKILDELGVKTNFGKIEQKFEIDQTKNITIESKFELFFKTIHNKKTLLMGEPGSGKSWFLTNFISYLENNKKRVIRHYCFTKTDDENNDKRATSDTFFGNLISDVIKYYPELETKKTNRYAANLEELNLLLSHITDDLIIIIDGLDHINRTLKNSTVLSPDKTKIIEFISQIVIPDNISVILGSQSVEEVKILVENFAFSEYKIVRWSIEDILLLMNKYLLDDCLLEEQQLSQLLLDKSEGNPLYLTYIIKSLKNEANIALETIEELPQYDKNLKIYYEYLVSQVDCNNTSEILSCLDFRVTINELKEIIPMSHHLEKNLKILSPVLNENYARGGIKLYHDSFRRFNLEKLESIANLYEIYQYIIQWLEIRKFYKYQKSYRYLLGYYVKSEQYDKAKEYATNDFLTKSLYNGFSEVAIKMNYNYFLKVAKLTHDWSLFIYISELNRTLNAVLSEHNEFEQHFEQYFETIGFIYGFERANEILFFDGKKNFSDNVIAKAFYIAEKNGYVPSWKLIEDFFKEINLENFRFYISYLISTSKLDNFFEKNLKKITAQKYGEFFRIFVEEIYYQLGFEKILEFYDNCKNDMKKNIAERVNTILDRTDCYQRIMSARSKKYTVLEKLTIDFTNGYIDEKNLNRFYNLVKKYAIYNIEALVNFEKTIHSSNFFHNWLKFFIKTFIIENNIDNNKYSNYEKLEKAIVENFKFLSSDVERFKGKPRIVDFTHQNSNLINLTIEQGLQYIQTKEAWSKVIEYLNKIPYNTLSIIEGKYVNSKNIDLIIDSYIQIEKSDEAESEGYSFSIDTILKLASLYRLSDELKKAKKQLKKAISYMTAYTFRKDTTLDEIIEPLESLNKLNNEFALKYTKKLLPLNLAVQSHSEDGKGIRWLYINWFKKFLHIERKLASKFLISKLMEDEYFWKYEYMFNHFVKISKELNPIILNVLFKLSPKTIDNDYINSFSDNIYNLLSIDRRLAKVSLINILSRDINKENDSLSLKTKQKLQYLKNNLNVSIPVKKNVKDDASKHSYSEQNLEAKLTNYFSIKEALRSKTIEQLHQYFDKYDKKLDDKDMIFLQYYINESQDDELTKKILLPIIQKKFGEIEDYYENLRFLIKSINCSEELKIFLLVNIFVYSKGGWYENFVNKEALKDAVNINQSYTLKYLSEALEKKFQQIYYYSQSTTNLIIAFEYVELQSDEIQAMYKRAFKFITYRLPNEKDFDWQEIDDSNLNTMNNDEIAIVFILVKLKHYDKSIQEEILYAINYLVKYDCELLIKPLKWFFTHIEQFPQLSVAGMLEIFLLNIDEQLNFFLEIKEDVKKVTILDNLYMNDCIEQLYLGF